MNIFENYLPKIHKIILKIETLKLNTLENFENINLEVPPII